MGDGGGPGVGDLDQDAVALVVVLGIAVLLPLQALYAADLASDPAARHRLEVRARPQRLGAQLLCSRTASGVWNSGRE